MTIQAKGWLSNVVHVLYTIRWQKILMTWRSFLMVYLWISLLSGVVSQKLQDFSKALMVIIPVQGCFPVYRLTVSQARKTNQQHWWWFLQYQNVSKVYLLTSGVKQTTKLFRSPMVIFPVPQGVSRCTVWQVNQARKTNQKQWWWFLQCFSMYRLTVSQAKKTNQSPFSLHIFKCENVRKNNRTGMVTPTIGTSWETNPSENNNGRMLYAKSILFLQAHAAEQVDTESNITSSNKLRESKMQRSLE